MRPTLQSIVLDVDGMSIAGIRQYLKDAQAQPRLLCLHGWLDNANSFVPMMPYLPAFDLVAVDLPGHGYSDPSNTSYLQAEVMVQVVKIMQALGWDDCHLMGHSMGGCIAPLVAVAARTFASKEEAVAVRLKAAQMEAASAKLIIDRQLIEDGDGFRWRFDPALRLTSFQYQTEAQVQTILSTITCPTLTVVANQGYLVTRHQTEDRLAKIKHHESVSLTGNHHLHMDTPEPVAAAINNFLGTRPALGG